ncbi:MAG: hypothetical protein KDD60_11275, partial [Bdellovibrionales bacterium]|nr:hypothetical protein [Bdellovibrionales bacterium]
QLVTSSGITIESSESTVSIVAGESTITVDPEGVVSIKSNGDLTVEADQNLILKGQTITLDGNRIDINSATDTNIESGINTNIDSNVKSSVTSASLTEIKGAVVTIN